MFRNICKSAELQWSPTICPYTVFRWLLLILYILHKVIIIEIDVYLLQAKKKLYRKYNLRQIFVRDKKKISEFVLNYFSLIP